MGNQSADSKKLLDSMNEHGERAWAALEAGDGAQAVREYEEALAIADLAGAEEAEAIFSTYMAVALRQEGEKTRAVALLERAAALARELSMPEVVTHARLLLAEIMEEEGRLGEATASFLDALESAADCGDVSAVELALSRVGRIYLERGWAEQARACFMQALDLREETPDKAAILGSVGLCLAELGRFDDSIQYFRTACLEAELAEDVESMSISRGSEGNVWYELGDFDAAVRSYREALDLARQVGDRRREGIWLGNLGTTSLKLGDTGAALEFCSAAAEIARAEDDLQSLAAHLDSLGDIYSAAGELGRAAENYEEALSLSEKAKDTLGQRIYLANMGKVNERLGQLQPAFEYLGKAVELFDMQRSAIKTDDLKTSFANRGQDLYKDMVRVCLALGKRVEALEYVGRAKSRALLDLLSNSPIDISHLQESTDAGLRQLVEKEQQLRAQIDHLERVFWSGPAPETGTRGGTATSSDTKAIYAEWRETVNQLRRCHPNYATLVSANTLGFGDMKRLWSSGESPEAVLDDKTAIVEYFWTDDFLLAASLYKGVLEPDVQVISEGDSKEMLEMDIETFLEMSSTEGWEVPVSLSRRLYETLMAKVEEKLPEEIERIVLVPHGSLYHLPFAALHDGDGYLCQRFAFSYLPSITLIPVLAGGRVDSAREMAARYLVSAISDYSATRKDGLVFSSTLRSSAGLDDLTYTMEEAQSIFALGSSSSEQSRLLTNEEVKSSLPSLFSQYPVVHFAGHAIFNPEEPMASGLVLSDGTVLTAASILERSALRTTCGRLLVLSACQTGVNLVTAGGEILGLARALMYAGMPNLVLSLWEVADRSTATLMQEFHRNWRAGEISIARALQLAQQKAVAEGQPVHAWAPFIHFGID